MKKFLFLIIAIIAVMFCTAFAGCGNNNEDLNYKKACEEKDWAKAYSIVDRLNEINREKRATAKATKYKDFFDNKNGDYTKNWEASKNAEKNYKEANKYVILQEALSVLEEHGENGLIRIPGIIKEHKAEWLYNELITVMNSVGNEDLTRKLVEMDPHRAILTLETPDVSGILNQYFIVKGNEAKIEKSNKKEEYCLNVSLIRIKPGTPQTKTRNKILISFVIHITDKDGNELYSDHARDDWNAWYTLYMEHIEGKESINLTFAIKKESLLGMKKFSIESAFSKY